MGIAPRGDAAAITATRQQVLERIRSLVPSQPRTILVAIDGRGGAGKSSLAGWLAGELAASVIHTDDFTHQWALRWEWERFHEEVLVPLSEDRDATYSPLDWLTAKARDRLMVPTGGVVILEGVSASRLELGRPWDITVWVECPADVRIARGLDRDGDEAYDDWMRWEAQENRYVAEQHPHERADLVVDGMESI